MTERVTRARSRQVTRGGAETEQVARLVQIPAERQTFVDPRSGQVYYKDTLEPVQRRPEDIHFGH